MTPIEVIPDARRHMRSLSDMGYDFAQAIADVVDNSIAAEATDVRIHIEFDGDESWVRIADNGAGMRPEVLKEAMRYGANREYDEDDLRLVHEIRSLRQAHGKIPDFEEGQKPPEPRL